MTRQRILVGAFLLAAVLWIVAGLRDIFAPGFFNISSRVMSTRDILLEFAVAAIFIALAGLVIRDPEAYTIHKK